MPESGIGRISVRPAVSTEALCEGREPVEWSKRTVTDKPRPSPSTPIANRRPCGVKDRQMKWIEKLD